MRALAGIGWGILAVAAGVFVGALGLVMGIGGWVTVGLGFDHGWQAIGIVMVVGGAVIFLGGVVLGVVAALVVMVIISRARSRSGAVEG